MSDRRQTDGMADGMSTESEGARANAHVPGGEAGMIFGKVTTSDFQVTVTGHLEANEYVMVQHEDGWVLCQVIEVKRESNLTSAQANAMASGEEVEFKEMVNADVAIIGRRDDRGLLQVPGTPLRPGSPVFSANDELIKSVLGLRDDPDKGAYIGLLAGHEIQVFVPINLMVSKHVSILAKTGAGKSYLSGDLIEELMKHGVTVVIVDPHGEYGSLREAGDPPKARAHRFRVHGRGYAKLIHEFSPDQSVNPGTSPLRFSIRNMTPREILSLTGNRGALKGMPILRKITESLTEYKKDWNLDDVIRVMLGDEDLSRHPMVQDLEYLREMGILAEEGTKVTDIVQEGRTSIINLRGTPPDVQEIIVNRILSSIFELRKRNKLPPMLVVVEEAHNFCPQAGEAASSKTLRTIASEGRKFGLGLVIVSQRAAKIDKNVLSQCGTQFVLKVTNPNDLATIEKSMEGLTKGMIDEIQRLSVGFAIISSVDFAMPLFVEVRERETKHGGESIKVV